MREIKFQYVFEMYGSICKVALTLEQVEEGLASKDSFPSNAKIIAKRQYTGLKDCNGVEIYEGDVVYIGGYGFYEVEFPFLELYDAAMENDIGQIISNIHENPELLEGMK